MDIFLIALIILASLAIFDLMVGVSNDAVNFLNSSIGSRVAPLKIILIIASLGIIAGVTFSSGMMEVARKGIFHPKFFLMPDLIVIFLAVMITDILLLDMFNTFGLPTSTTVSIVFELLGAAVAVSLIKIMQSGEGFATLSNYINTGKALMIISGILLSVVIAFFFGAVVQYVTRLIFTFNYQKKMKRYGGLWGGVALSMITYFILIKGAKGASFITPETLAWIKAHTFLILAGCFVVFAILFQALLVFTRINILKPIVLIGTFALAMAFAANDLVNFIGVPLAGLNAYQVAAETANPLTASMGALQAKVPSNTNLLLLAGAIMVVTLWLSKKSRTVTETEVNLGRQDEGIERFGSSPLSRVVVRMASVPIDLVKKITPPAIARRVGLRLKPPGARQTRASGEDAPSFDLLRASVNLMVASAVVSYATSHKLPLSTTYVTFMVAMGSSLADQAWGRETAVYRVTGVLTVIGGWFLTAMAAFTVAMVFAFFIFYLKLYAAVVLLAFAVFMIWRNHHLHSKRKEEVKSLTSFSLKKVTTAQAAVSMSFEHSGAFLKEVGDNLANAFDGLFLENRTILKAARDKTKKIQVWANVIMANIFKTLYLLKKYDVSDTQKYISTIRSLQEIAESHRDLVIRAYHHVDNLHTGVSEDQRQELEQIRGCVVGLLKDVSAMLLERKPLDYEALSSQHDALLQLVSTVDKHQIERIHRRETKTRLSILFYGYLDGCVKISDQTLALVKIFRESFMVENGVKEADTAAP
jgi:phosphate/sulfate permease